MVKYLFLLFPIMAIGQFHGSIGTMSEKGSTALKVGYSEFVDWFGVDVSVRHTEYPTPERLKNFVTLENSVKAKFAFSQIGFGTAYDFDRSHWHFIFNLRNSFQISPNTAIFADFDQSFRGETYLMFGVSIKVNGKASKKKRFF